MAFSPLLDERSTFVLSFGTFVCIKRHKIRCAYPDDGSTDNSRDLIDKICQDIQFIGIHFSRNFGHQAAVTAGLQYSTGDFIAVIDGDLQDPPELIPEMILEMLENEADVIYGVRTHRKENFLKRSSYFVFYRLLAWITPLEIPLDSGDFGIMTRRVVDVINSMPEHHRFVRGLRAYSGFKQIPFKYKRAVRGGGEPKYNLSRLLKLALDGIFTFSEVPLKLATFLGFTIAVLSLIYGIFLLIWRITSNQEIPGFATISIGMFFLGGIQLFFIGVLGEYIGRIHNEVKGRPTFIIDSIVKYNHQVNQA